MLVLSCEGSDGHLHVQEVAHRTQHVKDGNSCLRACVLETHTLKQLSSFLVMLGGEVQLLAQAGGCCRSPMPSYILA